MREVWLEYSRWCWMKDKVPQAAAEMVYYLSRCDEDDRNAAWQEIAQHARFSEKVSELLSAQKGKSTLL